RSCGRGQLHDGCKTDESSSRRRMTDIFCPQCHTRNGPLSLRCTHCDALLDERPDTWTEHELTTPSPPRADPIGRTLSHYRVERQLGQGGMGVVYRAVDQKLGRVVALKLLAGTSSAGEQARARFLREARAASKIDHPNVGTIFEI